MFSYLYFNNYFKINYFKFNPIVGHIEMVPLKIIWEYKYNPTHQSVFIDCDDPRHSQR